MKKIAGKLIFGFVMVFIAAGLVGAADTLLLLKVENPVVKILAAGVLSIGSILLLLFAVRSNRKTVFSLLGGLTGENGMLRFVLDAAPTALHAVDAEGNWLYINRASEKLLVKNGVIADRDSACGKPAGAKANLLGNRPTVTYSQWMGIDCKRELFPLKNGAGAANGFAEAVTDLAVDEKLLAFLAKETRRAAANLDKLAKGGRNLDFAQSDAEFYFEKVKENFAEIDAGLQAVQKSDEALTADVAALAAAAADGDFAARVQQREPKQEGTRREIVDSVNALAAALGGPLQTAVAASEKLASGERAELPASENAAGRTLAANFAKMQASSDTLSAAVHELCRSVDEGNLSGLKQAIPAGVSSEIITALVQTFAGLGERLETIKADLAAVADYSFVPPAAEEPAHAESGVLGEISDSVQALGSQLYRLQEALVKAGEGDLEALAPWATGQNPENDPAAAAVLQMAKSLKALLAEAQSMEEAAVQGNLHHAVRAEGLPGVYGQTALHMGNAMNAMAQPSLELLAVLEKMVKCNLAVSMTGEYQGDYATIREQLNYALLTYNDIIYDINKMAKQVLAGTKEVSGSARELSQNTAEQADAIERLNISMEEISSKTQENAHNAATASNLTVSAKENAVTGNDEMKEMLVAMSEINESSVNISKIIKVIDDIAFQTNILALNAAVEAARAGQYGKGFAVVAEEVRNLAAKSAEAAKDTTALIEGSMQRVERGTTIANHTSSALVKILENNTNADSFVEKIAGASNKQAADITKIKQGIEQVSSAVQQNSATSETSASTCAELTGKAETLKGFIDKFWIDYRGRE